MDMAQLFLDAAEQLDKAADASDASIPRSPSRSPSPSSRSSSPFAPPLRPRSASAPPSLPTETRRPEPAWSPAECVALHRAKLAHGRHGWAAVKRAMAAQGWKGRALSSLEARWAKPEPPVLPPASRVRRPNGNAARSWTPLEDQGLVKWLEQAAARAVLEDLETWTSKHVLHRRPLLDLVGRLEHLVQAGHANRLDTSKVVKVLFNLRSKLPPVVAELKQVRVVAATSMSLMDRVVSKKTGVVVAVKVNPRPAQVSVPAARRLLPPPAKLVARSPAPSPSPPPPPLPPRARPPSPPKMPQPGRPPAEAYFPSRTLPPPARTTRWFTRPPINDLPRYTQWVPPTLNVDRTSIAGRTDRRFPLPPPPPPSASASLPALSCSSSTTAPSTSPPPVAPRSAIPLRAPANGPRSMAHLLEPAPAAAPAPRPPPPPQQKQLKSSIKSTGKRLWDVLDSEGSMTVFERRTMMRVGGRGGTWLDGGRQGGA